LDVVLQLITFFMMLVHFGTRVDGTTKAVRLPLAPAAVPSTELANDRLIVSIDSHGRLLLDGDTLEVGAASEWWAEQARKRRAGLDALEKDPLSAHELSTVVILRADRATSYGAVRRALAEAQEKGFANFSLVVLRSRLP
jgi:biopolymer transport protein ExbD